MSSEPHPLRHMKPKHGVISTERTEQDALRGELKHGAQVVDGGSISNAAALSHRKAQVSEIDPRRERGHEEGYTLQRQRLIEVDHEDEGRWVRVTGRSLGTVGRRWRWGGEDKWPIRPFQAGWS